MRLIAQLLRRWAVQLHNRAIGAERQNMITTDVRARALAQLVSDGKITATQASAATQNGIATVDRLLAQFGVDAGDLCLLAMESASQGDSGAVFVTGNANHTMIDPNSRDLGDRAVAAMERQLSSRGTDNEARPGVVIIPSALQVPKHLQRGEGR